MYPYPVKSLLFPYVEFVQFWKITYDLLNSTKSPQEFVLAASSVSPEKYRNLLLTLEDPQGYRSAASQHWDGILPKYLQCRDQHLGCLVRCPTGLPSNKEEAVKTLL